MLASVILCEECSRVRQITQEVYVMGTASKRRKPNERLRYQRHLRGWTLREVADKLYDLCASEEQRESGMSADTVGRWELGVSKPSLFYQQKLCALFGQSAEELGLIEPLLPPEEHLPGVASRGQQGAPVPLPSSSQPIDLLAEASGSSSEQALGAWLAAGAADLSALCAQGWTLEEVLSSLQVVLKGVQAMPNVSRRQLLQLGAAAVVVSSVPMPEGSHISVEERIRLHSALSECIQAGWKLFVTASMPQVLVVGQAQLHLLHQSHAELYPSMRPLFYSPVYRLIGAALFFQSRYAEAMQAHTQAYLTALEACDPWNMAESLGWQAGVLKACGRQAESIQTTEAALRLLDGFHEAHILTSRARLLAQWAESAALLGERNVMEEKLSASAELLNQFEGSDEFDAAIWQLYRGTCALYIGNSASADTYLEQALHDLRPDLLHQRAYAALLQAQARLNMGDMKGSLEVVGTAVPLVVAADSPLLDRGLIDQIEQLTATFPRNAEVREIANEVQRHPRLCAFHAQQSIPRYLEAKL